MQTVDARDGSQRPALQSEHCSLGAAPPSDGGWLFVVLPFKAADVIRQQVVGDAIDEAAAASGEGAGDGGGEPGLDVGVGRDHAVEVDVDEGFDVAVTRGSLGRLL